MLYNNISFRYPFRDYQARVLNTLDEKLGDNKIHVVAAPGSGKTVLGLEIVRRLDIPVLILTPSISIREQWIDRFLSLFVNDNAKDYWSNNISDSLDVPAIITCITYQALYAKFQDTNIETVADKLKSIGVKGLVLDEAHHLKREWWKALTDLNDKLESPAIISLTATPPYDASSFEWNKYNTLCGEIDIELFTPEMVQKKSLAPYQDFVYLCTPTDTETSELLQDNYDLNTLYKSILSSRDLYNEISVSPLLTATSNIPEVFFNNQGLLLALVDFMKGFAIPAAYTYEGNEEKATKMIGTWNDELVRRAKFTGQNYHQITDNPVIVENVFLTLIPFLFEENSFITMDYQEKLKTILKNNHLLIKNKFSAEKYNERKEKLLKNTSARLSAICDITLTELKNMKDDLCMLILLDNIGKENMSLIGTSSPISSIDCVSVFENLRRYNSLEIEGFESNNIMDNNSSSRLAVLCGSVCILPCNVRLSDDMTSKEIGDTGYKTVTINDSNRKSIVSFVTDLVNDRIINILIGTVSLLGEGWDAPAINTVILGSNISSYVQSNQMRGRALRIDPTDTNKTANIWHLCTLNPVSYFDETRFGSSLEYNSLCNRFESLLGIDSEGTNISNNIDRLHLPATINIPFTIQFIDEYNTFSKTYSSKRSLIYSQWEKLNATYDLGKVRESITVKECKKEKIIQSGQLNLHEISSISTGLLFTLKELNLISKKVTLTVRKNTSILKHNQNKNINITVDNCSSRERKLVIESIKQIILPEKYGRYIICKKAFLRGSILLGVPECFKTKANIQLLIKNIPLINLELLEAKSEKAIQLIFKHSLREKKILINILKCGE